MKSFNPKDYQKTAGEATATEILQQPSVYRKITEILLSRSDKIKAFMNRVLSIKGIRILYLGAGSSAFCGEMLAAESMALSIPAEAPHTTDIVASPETVLYDTPTLIISFARSGNSPESVGAVQYARSVIKDLYEVCITCAADGRLAQITKDNDRSLKIILPEESCDKGFAMTSSLTGMAVAAFGLLHYNDLDSWAKDVNTLADTVEAKFDYLVSSAYKVTSEYDFDRMAILGCGTLRGAAREAAVKMSELSAGKVNVVYDTSTGFRHGPKSMVNSSTLSMHYISPNEHTKKYDLDLLNEMYGEKSSNPLVALTCGNKSEINADYTIDLGDEEYNDGLCLYAAVKYTIFAQLLAFFYSQKLGITTDDPCPGGEVNRVVQGVIIYPYNV